MLPGALIEFVVLAPEFLDLVVDGRPAQALPARVLSRDRIQDVFTQRHSN